jgi:hypothetical protein
VQAVTLHTFRLSSSARVGVTTLAHLYGLAFSSGFRAAMAVAGLASLAMAAAACGLGPARRRAARHDRPPAREGTPQRAH